MLCLLSSEMRQETTLGSHGVFSLLRVELPPFPTKRFCHSWLQLHAGPPEIIYYPASGLNKPQIYFRSLKALGRRCKQQLSLGRTGCNGSPSLLHPQVLMGISKDAQWNISPLSLLTGPVILREKIPS